MGNAVRLLARSNQIPRVRAPYQNYRVYFSEFVIWDLKMILLVLSSYDLLLTSLDLCYYFLNIYAFDYVSEYREHFLKLLNNEKAYLHCMYA